MIEGSQGETGEIGELVVRGKVEKVRERFLWNLVPKLDGEVFCEPRGGFAPCNFEVFQVGEGEIEVVEETVDGRGCGCSLDVESVYPVFIRDKKVNSLSQVGRFCSRPLHVEYYADT
jgi:hypothetical protein